jgi:hypothetical protein
MLCVKWMGVCWRISGWVKDPKAKSHEELHIAGKNLVKKLIRPSHFLGPPLPMGAQDRSLREAVGIRWTDSCLEIFMERQGKPGSGGNQKRGSA